ncbi:hypothetical protein KEM56_002880 [Ascosphaera pollenicola]|nr:hypothetical protein KEM56_002880 [Ascosphaera pollenicola]
MSNPTYYPCVPCIVSGVYTITNNCSHRHGNACSFCESPDLCTEMPVKYQPLAKAVLTMKKEHGSALSDMIREKCAKDFNRKLAQLKRQLTAWFAEEMQHRAEVRKRREEEENRRQEEEEEEMRKEKEALQRYLELKGLLDNDEPEPETVPSPSKEVSLPGLEEKVDQLAVAINGFANVILGQTQTIVNAMQLMMETMGYQQPVDDKRKRDEVTEVEDIKEQKRRCVGDGVAEVKAATTAPVDVPEQKQH